MESFCFITSVMLVPVLYISGFINKKGNTILDNVAYQKVFWILFTVLALIGISTVFYLKLDRDFYLFMICPFYSFSLYRLMFYVFVLIRHRNPVVAAKTTDTKLFWDRVFGFSFWILTLIVPVGIIGSIIHL